MSVIDLDTMGAINVSGDVTPISCVWHDFFPTLYPKELSHASLNFLHHSHICPVVNLGPLLETVQNQLAAMQPWQNYTSCSDRQNRELEDATRVGKEGVEEVEGNECGEHFSEKRSWGLFQELVR
jgi:hypothetical protein